jgi:Holliday junction resolvase-like predicted endonuclease
MPEAQELEALQTGVRGETYAYWYLRRLGHIFGARNYMPEHAKGALDLIGFDGDTLAFVEVRTRLVGKASWRFALPELSIIQEKHETVIRTAHYFPASAISKHVLWVLTLRPSTTPPGQPPVVRLHELVVPRWSMASSLAYTRRPREWSFSIKESPLCECQQSVR